MLSFDMFFFSRTRIIYQIDIERKYKYITKLLRNETGN